MNRTIRPATSEQFARFKAGLETVHAMHPTLGRYGVMCELEQKLTGRHLVTDLHTLVTCTVCLEWIHA